MTRQFSLLIALGCSALLILTPVAALYLLLDIELFASLARSNLSLPIQWQTVSDTQWYSLWLLTLIYIGIGLAGLYFLRRAFANFAKGELFNHSNSRDLRLFAIMLFVQALTKPLHFTLSSVLLSFNHPAGEKMLSVSLGSGEIKVIALAMILWVMSDLLVRGSQLENENKQFI
ncbi:DUF2975 domain-containing protein [Lacimicrobium alkaliphilum]|uniref:DUF2975 domain-containing protein n=1 Tax=Lacimicrobium alkaliphilum TaxID=1526571 RepID=A0A0U3AI17_9ALTE|nr:DUF2975 domain-containing protein [Lacimicrobium alkaliphilum]ALS98353.1 hypothetical protein AT746_08860 [Lacimicrobium alkaliphilum]